MNLREWRLANRRTQVEVAASLDIEQAHLSKLERRLVGPSLTLAQKILDLTDGAVTLLEMTKLPTEPAQEQDAPEPR